MDVLLLAPFALEWILEGRITLALCFWLGLCLLLTALRSCRLRLMLTGVLGFLAFFLRFVNAQKMRLRMEPVLFSDVYLLRDGLHAAKAFGIDWMPLCWAAAGLMALVVLSLFVKKRTKRRRILPLLGLALLFTLPGLCKLDGSQPGLLQMAQQHGTLYTAIAVASQKRPKPDAETVRAAYENLRTPPDEGEHPNILLVLAESFTDDGGFFHDLAATCQSGWLTVPKAGGGTSDTEYEVLTGIRSQYGVSPYALGLEPTQSLASLFRARGYATCAVHWYPGLYYNRADNLQKLGFAAYHSADTTCLALPRVGEYVSDRAHYAWALETMKTTSERDFVFVITMQNHGPYAGMEDYQARLAESNRALKALTEQLQAWEEPTLLVFFGDHTPPGAKAGFQTPYLIWSNVQNQPLVRNLYAWQLGAEALHLAGMHDPFLHYARTLSAPDDTYALLCHGRQCHETQMSLGGEMELVGFRAAQVGDAVYVDPILKDPGQKKSLTVNGQRFDAGWVYAGAGPITLGCALYAPNGECWNRSGEQTFASAGELLAASEPWAFETHSIQWTSAGQNLWKSQSRYDIPDVTALTLAGKRLDGQPLYALERDGQYAVDEEGFVWLFSQAAPGEAQLHVFAAPASPPGISW